jgi:hypothetical protein
MAIKRMGIANPSANSSTLVFTADASYLSSVLATNKGATSTTLRAWIAPSGATLNSQYGYIFYDIELPAANTIESHRFALSIGDRVYVSSTTANTSFSLNGIYDSGASIDDHIVQTTGVHGIADTSVLVTTSTTNSLNNRLIAIELGLGIFD